MCWADLTEAGDVLARGETMSVVSLIPMAFVKSITRSVAFYGKLGFVVSHSHTPDGRAEPVWVSLQSGSAHLMLSEATAPIDPREQAILFYVYSKDVVAFRTTLLEAGVDAGVMNHPFWAQGGEFRVTDPDGYTLLVTHT